MKRVHKCPLCGRTWKHHKAGGPCPANRRNYLAVARAMTGQSSLPQVDKMGPLTQISDETLAGH